MTPTPDTRRWRCLRCNYVYVSQIELAGPPTHPCNPAVKRWYELTPDPDPEESDA